MRSRRPTPEQQDVVSRRLAELSTELAGQLTAVPDDAFGETALPARRAVGGEWWEDHTRIVDRDADARPALRVVEPSPMPEPAGRHAARRPWRPTGLLPESLRGRVSLGPGPVAVVAVLVALGLGFTCWRIVRGDPEPAVPVAAVAAGEGASGDIEALAPVTGAEQSVPPAPAAGSAPTTVTVDVAGKVRRPGIVVLKSGARVVDAVDRAGGPRPGVDLTTLNLARLLVDGEQILVGSAVGAPAAPPPVAGAAPGVTAPAALVDLNLATQAELETLPGVGPVTAAAIISWRDEHGGFSAVNELLEVDGIGAITLDQLTPLVTV